jgi:hypothetical protein
MSLQKDLGPDQLRKLRPKVCLQARGRLAELAQPGSELSGNLATAACLSFEDGEVSPQEFLTVFEAIKQCLELSDESDPKQRVNQAVAEAFELTASLLNKKVNKTIVDWIGEWLPFIDSDENVNTFMDHLSSVAKQYSLVMSLKHGG